MNDRKWWQKRPEALSLTHYRTEDQTYFDTAWIHSDMAELGWEAQYAWIRLVSGPEYERQGFPVSRVREALGQPQEFNYTSAIDSLIKAQLIVEDGDYYTFPNVEWGTPPEDQEER